LAFAKALEKKNRAHKKKNRTISQTRKNPTEARGVDGRTWKE